MAASVKNSKQLHENNEIGCETASFVHLPTEILEQILINDSLNHIDLINFGQTCSYFGKVSQFNELWKQKMSQRWPSLLDRYDRQQTYNWFEEYKQRHLFGRKVCAMVAEMSPKYYNSPEISREAIDDFTALTTEHNNAGDFLIDELMCIIHDKDIHNNLTLKYYAVKVLRYLQQSILSQKIQIFMALSQDQQNLETGTVLLAQWCQPTENVTHNEISDHLDSLATEVKVIVHKDCPSHPILTTEVHNSTEMSENVWTCDQCRQLLDSLNTVMFIRHHYQGNREAYYNKTNSYIDKVLHNETGIPITLCIVYSAVARRLGIVCEPVNFPSHFLLRWKQHPLSSPDQMYTYIDVFNKGKFLSQSDLAHEFHVPAHLIGHDNIQVARPIQVIERMIRNLVAIGHQEGRMGDTWLCLRNALELSLLITPNDFEQRLQLVRINLNLNINIPDVIDCLQSIVDEDQNRIGLVAYLTDAAQAQLEENKTQTDKQSITVKTRQKEKDALYSVGLITKHRRYDYRCVVYSWDTKCEASKEWIVQMGVDRLPHKDKQPFYNVLVEDGSSRYAAQENLTLDDSDPAPITHPEVGRYFTSFQGSHYCPNKEKEAEFPEDLNITLKLIGQREKEASS